MTIIPCAYEMKFLEFQLRESGGGFLGEIDPNNLTSVRRSVGAVKFTASGNELVRAAQFLVVAIDENGATQQMILDEEDPDEGCQQWNARRAGMKLMHPERVCSPPMWATVWNLRPCRRQRQGFVVQLFDLQT